MWLTNKPNHARTSRRSLKGHVRPEYTDRLNSPTDRQNQPKLGTPANSHANNCVFLTETLQGRFLCGELCKLELDLPSGRRLRWRLLGFLLGRDHESFLVDLDRIHLHQESRGRRRNCHHPRRPSEASPPRSPRCQNLRAGNNFCHRSQYCINVAGTIIQ